MTSEANLHRHACLIHYSNSTVVRYSKKLCFFAILIHFNAKQGNEEDLIEKSLFLFAMSDHFDQNIDHRGVKVKT